MTIKLLSPQIPQFWDAIKYACTKADEVAEKDLPSYLNGLLLDLLNDKAQCFIRLDSDRNLCAVMVTKVMADRVSGVKHLYLQCLYSFKKVEESEWQNDWPLITEFMKKEGCAYIAFESRNYRIWQLGESVGFKEFTRRYVYREVV